MEQVMSRSVNNHDGDWKREWEEEITLTPEEQKEVRRPKAIEDAQTAQILEDLHMMELEEAQEEEARRNKVRYAKSYLKERGWRDSAIWLLSDAEILEAAEVEAMQEEAAYDNYDFGDEDFVFEDIGKETR